MVRAFIFEFGIRASINIVLTIFFSFPLPGTYQKAQGFAFLSEALKQNSTIIHLNLNCTQYNDRGKNRVVWCFTLI